MNTIDRLVKTAEENKTILCFGVDPDLIKVQPAMPSGSIVDKTIGPFFHNIIDKLLDENAISALKPNYAFFAQYGFDGLFVLEDLFQDYSKKIPIILDGKRGDIGKTSEAYAKEIYDFWGADATTISPYMGTDSVTPFLREGKLAYVLCKTSNESSNDFQKLKVGSGKNAKFVYELVAEKTLDWSNKNNGSVGLVVGATDDSIKRVMGITKGKLPMLIPGVGSQGGDLELVLQALKGPDFATHRINASSSIAYAYRKAGGNPAAAALKEAEKLNKEIRKYF
ncbi:orotidine-5'-phosphate decarboxylase [Candidatus Micrarchaeota archaeon]|nr:orotidine-5'-phosphate decarboxylase [Candidatus Micrarchaeota archaeon]